MRQLHIRQLHTVMLGNFKNIYIPSQTYLKAQVALYDLFVGAMTGHYLGRTNLQRPFDFKRFEQ